MIIASMKLEAAGIDVPPRMNHDISMFAIGSYAMHLIDICSELLSDPADVKVRQRNLGILRGYAGLLGGRVVGRKGDRDWYFAPMNLAGWGNPYGDPMDIQKKLKKAGVMGITCYLVYLENRKTFATYDGSRGILTLNVEMPDVMDVSGLVEYIDKLPGIMGEMKKSIAHELIHMVQWIGYYAVGSNSFVGLPTKKVRDMGSDPTGIRYRKLTKEWITEPYAMHDVEFYTNWNDNMSALGEHLEGMKDGKMEYVRRFIGADGEGLSPFFAFLKKFDLKRWQLAVKRTIQWLDQNRLIG